MTAEILARLNCDGVTCHKMMIDVSATAKALETNTEEIKTAIQSILQSSNDNINLLSSLLQHSQERLVSHAIQRDLVGSSKLQDDSGMIKPDGTSTKSRMTCPLSHSSTTIQAAPASEGKSTSSDLESSHYQGLFCTEYCSCCCHLKRLVRATPATASLDKIFGVLFICYTGSPFLRQRCNVASCRRQSAPSINLTYYCPVWAFMRAWLVSITGGVTPSVTVKVPRVVPFDSQLFHFIRKGNLDGIKHLFSRGVASPFDVYEPTGLTTLHTAMSFANIEICRFLICEGADPSAEARSLNARYPAPITCNPKIQLTVKVCHGTCLAPRFPSRNETRSPNRLPQALPLVRQSRPPLLHHSSEDNPRSQPRESRHNSPEIPPLHQRRRLRRTLCRPLGRRPRRRRYHRSSP